MKPYPDRTGDSGISAYEAGRSWIRIRFKHGGTYEYGASIIGAGHVRALKRLAESGLGLNTYINTHAVVRDGAVAVEE